MTRELRSRRSQQTGRGFSQLVWIFAAFVSGYVTASFYDMASLTRLIDQMQDKPVPVQPIAASRPLPAAPKPQFEFYTLLTKDSQGNIKRIVPARTERVERAPRDAGSVSRIEHAAQQSSSQTLNARSSLRQPPSLTTARSTMPVVSQPRVMKPVIIQPNTATATVNATFMIQIAAFNRRADAESMKASLLLKGFDASVMAYDARPGVHWFRVVIGPYHNKAEVDRIQTSLLQRHHIRGIVRQIPREQV